MKDKDKLYHQRRIGLTGGIASGKSTIANYVLLKKNIPILDADNYSKNLINPGEENYHKIIDKFGSKIIDRNSVNQSINRTILRQIIFADKDLRLWLENLLHPNIRENMQQDCYALKDEKVLLLVIPLLFEAKFTDLCTEIWLVKCSKEVQKQRLMKRDGLSNKYAETIINSQMNFAEKVKNSNVILSNEDYTNTWKREVDNLII